LNHSGELDCPKRYRLVVSIEVQGYDLLAEKNFDTGEVSINYAEGSDNGPPLVLLHGGGNRWQQFLPIIPALAFRWHIYAPDMRGHGKSGWVPGRYKYTDRLEDTVAFVNHMATEPAVLFGKSAGGLQALGTAARLPDKVKALIIGDTPLTVESIIALGREDRAKIFKRLQGLAGRPMEEELIPLLKGTVDPHLLRARAKRLSQQDPSIYEYQSEGRPLECYDIDFERVMGLVGCPVLLVQGDPSLGALMADGDVDSALSVLSDATHVQIDTGHGIGMDRWEVSPLLRAVAAFLEAIRG